MSTATLADPALYVLQFPPLQPHGSSLRFPCNASGVVALNSLSERARNNYFLARHGVGRDFSRPSVESVLKGPLQGLSHVADLGRKAYLETRPSPTAFA